MRRTFEYDFDDDFEAVVRALTEARQRAYAAWISAKLRSAPEEEANQRLLKTYDRIIDKHRSMRSSK